MVKPRKSIYDLSKPDFNVLVEKLGYEPYRSLQIWEGIHRNGWSQPGEFVNLPNKLIDNISEEIDFEVIFPEKSIFSEDRSTEKMLFRLRDNMAVETVLMKYKHRNTVCISTQVGCAMDCKFCATGNMGFKRNLTMGEIIAQVLFVSKRLLKESKKLTNIVIMGMGEPFNNYENTMDAIGVLNDKNGYNFGARRFTVSTVGIVPKIRRFSLENNQVNLAISLHAADNNLRSKLIPMNNKYPIEDLLVATDEYIDITHRRVSLEWAMIHDVNDDLHQAEMLLERISGKNYHVNLIPLNQSGFFNGAVSTREKIQAFKDKLESAGINCSVRLRRGIDIQAGCGQLLDRLEN